MGGAGEPEGRVEGVYRVTCDDYVFGGGEEEWKDSREQAVVLE